jgi:hypothetical protein
VGDGPNSRAADLALEGRDGEARARAQLDLQAHGRSALQRSRGGPSGEPQVARTTPAPFARGRRGLYRTA